MHYFSLRNISVFSGVFLVVYGLSLWMLLSLPGSRNMACVMGAYLTPWSIVLNMLLSAVIALSVVNMVEFACNRSQSRKAFVSGSSLLGTSFLFLTSFCASCSLPILAGLGIGGALNFISIYHGWFQILALLICAHSLWSSHKKVVDECNVCVL